MYTVSIPVRSRQVIDNPEKIYEQFVKCGAKRIFLTTVFSPNPEIYRKRLDSLKTNADYFQSKGLEVAVWVGSSLGHGAPLVSSQSDGPEDWSKYVLMVGDKGKSISDSFCPNSEPFLSDYCQFFADIAKLGIKMIMIDDDFRLHHRPAIGIGCCCDMHMAKYHEKLGEKVKRENLETLVYSGKPSKYRDEWLNLQKESLVGLAKNIRDHVNAVSKDTRVGVCASSDNWDQSGNILLDICKALAGDTRPFARLNGAPYWVPFHGTKLSYLIEVNRQQAFWCKDEDIEIFSEGDAYPRPRYTTSASLMEMFDMALMADGHLDGILKYILDYTDPTSELGYIRAMVHHKSEYEWISQNMSHRDAIGVDIINPCGKYKNADIHETPYVRYINDSYFHSGGAKMLCDASIPLTYGKHSVHIACGECARYVTADHITEGLVTDVKGALILQEKGVDLGIISASEPRKLSGTEIYAPNNEKVSVMSFERFQSLTLKDSCIVDSSINDMPVCYRYENATGNRFTVFAFDISDSINGFGTTRAFARQRQLISCLEWTGRTPLPCVCIDYPDLYFMVKSVENGMVIGLWNLSQDYIYSPTLVLNQVYSSVQTFNCTASLDKRNLKINEVLPPYSFVGIKVE